MELVIFFLRTLSIVWTVAFLYILVLAVVKRLGKFNFDLNIKAIMLTSLYVTSIYSWWM